PDREQQTHFGVEADARPVPEQDRRDERQRREGDGLARGNQGGVSTVFEIVAGRQFFDNPTDYINRIVNAESDADSDYWQSIDVDTYIVRTHIGIDCGVGQRQWE